MAVYQLLLFVLFALNISSMFSGFLLARRMGMYLMTQVMMLMLAMFAGLVGLAFGILLYPAVPVLFDLLHLIVLIDFVLVFLAALMEFIQVLPILMKTMQGAPIHSSHITNLLLTMFLALAMVIYYVDIATIM